MSQIVGLFSGLDQSKNTILRPPVLTVPAAAYTGNRIMKPSNATYAQQSVQTLDMLGNAAAHIRIANGGYRSTQRIINTALNGDAIKSVRLPNNIGTGLLGFTRIDGYGAPAGFLKLLDDRDQTAVFILSPGMAIGIQPNTHRLIFQGSGCDATSYASIAYSMETYIANIVFDVMPSTGILLSFGDYATFEVYTTGHPELVTAGNYGVEIPVTGLVVDFCANLIAAFNTAYIAAVEPVGSQTAYHWAKLIAADDLIYYRDSATDAWLIATDTGVQFNSIDTAMIRNLTCNATASDAQIIKQL